MLTTLCMTQWAMIIASTLMNSRRIFKLYAFLSANSEQDASFFLFIVLKTDCIIENNIHG